MSTLTVPEAKTHLGISGTTQDAELQTFIDAAEAILSNVVGPLNQIEATARVSGGARLVLPTAPIQSVSVVADTGGSETDLLLTGLDQRAGVVYFTDSWSVFGAAEYDVTYVAGWDEIPDDLLLAVKEMVRHLWASQRGGSRRPGSPTEETPAAGYLMPYRVEQLIAPYRLLNVA